MSPNRRRTQRVLRIFKDLAAKAEPGTGIWPGAINDALRAEDSPMGSWEVRFELSQLEAAGEVRCDPDSGAFFLATTARRAAKKRSSG